jgi:hypothetical protein
MIGAGQSGGYVGCPCDMVVLDSDDTVIDIDDVVTPRVRAAVNTWIGAARTRRLSPAVVDAAVARRLGRAGR